MIVAGAALVLLSSDAGATSRAEEKPRVIIIGFDGVDVVLAEQWMASGDLPNLKRLAEQGSFRGLGTANPAQSPVSWSVMETASNPGKTNIGDFVRRTFSKTENPESDGLPQPALAGAKRMSDPVPANELGDYVELSRRESLLLPLALSGRRWLALALLAGGVFLVITLLFRLAFRFPTWLSLLVGVVLGGGGVYCTDRFVLDELPTEYVVWETEMRGEPFWNALGEAGIRTTGLEVPTAFPAKAHANAKILGGLFTPDVGGGPGSWYVYTNDEWAMNDDSTSNGGTVYKLYEDADGVIRSTLRGPENFIAKLGYRDQINTLKARAIEPGLSANDRKETEAKLAKIRSEESAWRRAESHQKAGFEVRPDYAGRKVKITAGGETLEIVEGAYSDYFRLDFDLGPQTPFKAIARFYVEECRTDEDGTARLRLFVPPISVSPEEQPPWLPISSPRGFAGELAEAIGLYDTIGWACYTNALKDMETPVGAFMLGLEHVFGWRTRMLMDRLSRNDWDVLFHVEYVTDRVAHMLMAYTDPRHPLYDSKDYDGNLYRDKLVTAYGRTFPVRDGVKETYKEMDRVTGEVLAKIESGAVGDNVQLMIISDHGFQPFRYGVNLNVWLNRMGYLARIGEGEQIGGPEAAEDGQTGEQLAQYVDWKRTRAYSLGLGKIYINLEGREPRGIVKQEEFRALKNEIIGKLRAFIDPIEGHDNMPVFLNAYDSEVIYDGPYSEIATDPALMAGFGDIIIGFNQGYRVSWGTTLGGYEADRYATFGIGDNDNPWTGDHCGVDLPLVQGIFFSNFKVQEGVELDLLNIAPTVLDFFGIPLPEDWDGTPIPRQ